MGKEPDWVREACEKGVIHGEFTYGEGKFSLERVQFSSVAKQFCLIVMAHSCIDAMQKGMQSANHSDSDHAIVELLELALQRACINIYGFDPVPDREDFKGETRTLPNDR